MRRALIAVLAFVFPGVQFALAGRWWQSWALSLAVSVPMALVVAAGGWLGTSFLGLFAAVLVVCLAGRAVLAVVVRPEGVRPSAWLIIVWLLGSEVVTRLPLLAARLSAAEPFRFPSASMEPTLIAGDNVFAFKAGPAATYGRGSVIAYKAGSGSTYMKRVIGLAGDRVLIREGIVEVYDAPLTRGRCEADHPATDRTSLVCILEESDGRRWKTWPITEHQSDGSWVVPPDSLFLLGDYRDNSQDSRWEGFINVSQVVGVAHQIHWSSTETSVAWKRIGRSLDTLD